MTMCLALRFRQEALDTHAHVCVNVFGKQRKATTGRWMGIPSVWLCARSHASHAFPPPQPRQVIMLSHHAACRFPLYCHESFRNKIDSNMMTCSAPMFVRFPAVSVVCSASLCFLSLRPSMPNANACLPELFDGELASERPICRHVQEAEGCRMAEPR